MKKKIILIILVLLNALTMISLPSVYGVEIVDALVCNEIDGDTGDPIEESSFFFNIVSDVYAWVRLSDINDGQSLRFIWSSPGGVIISDNEVIASSSTSDYWDQFLIKGFLPEQDPGDWSVHIYLDGVLMHSEVFTLINYETLMLENELALLAVERLSEELAELYANYSIVQNEILSYISDIAQLSITYNELLEEYATIQEGYNTANDDLQELVVEYENIQNEYTLLSSDYDSLNEELSTTKKSLNNTRTLLYGSSGLAIILLIVSAYLINKGR